VSFSKENLKVKREIAEQETELNEWKTFERKCFSDLHFWGKINPNLK
jgi:hypothetical protein